MGPISWLIFGALVGWLASKVAGTDDKQGWILNIVLGIAGALLGGVIYQWLADDDISWGWDIVPFIVALLGAVAVSWGFAYLTRRRA